MASYIFAMPTFCCATMFEVIEYRMKIRETFVAVVAGITIELLGVGILATFVEPHFTHIAVRDPGSEGSCPH